MDLRSLRYFCAAAEAGSLTAAAERCHVAQPSISNAVAQLEQEFALRLFSRSKRGVTLTPEGEAFYQEAARLLTRPFAIRGVVQHGDKRGREIGYPTANLPVEHYLRPKYGVYAVTGRILSTGQELKGAANIGVRPQFDPPKELLEPYFFDFSGDLYGQEIEVAFHHFLRGEAKFDSLEGLIAQMEKDCDEARRLLG